MKKAYQNFIDSKRATFQPAGWEIERSLLNANAFDFQKDVVQLGIRLGKFGGWMQCGLGKTLLSLDWCHQLSSHLNENALILAPLSVAVQFVREGKKFGIPVNYARSQSQVIPGTITVTNYDMLKHFEPRYFKIIALDESSCIKNATGVTTEYLIKAFRHAPYKSVWSATPAPNDFMELGQQAEFLGIMKATEMLAQFFTHDGGDTSKWILRPHAESHFWDWITSWAIYLKKPSDLGYSDEGYDLPELIETSVVVKGTILDAKGKAYREPPTMLNEQRYIQKQSFSQRVKAAIELINDLGNQQAIVWCNTNDESAALAAGINGSLEVSGSDSRQFKEDAVLNFQYGLSRVLVTKPKIFGFGINMQHSHEAAFVGLSHSYETIYQAIRRQYRFGQAHPVRVRHVYHELEGAILANIKRKETEANRMTSEISKRMRKKTLEMLGQVSQDETPYDPQIAMKTPAWLMSEAS